MGKYAIHQSDANEKRLIEYLRARGAQVEKIHQPLDLLIAFRGHTAIAEVKTLRGSLNAAQNAFMTRWCGLAMILRSESDCDTLIETLRELAAAHHQVRGTR